MSVQSSNELYLYPERPSAVNSKCKASARSNLSQPVVKRSKPFIVVLVQQHSNHEKVILKLTDRMLGYRSNKGKLNTVQWTSSIDDHL